MSTSAGAPKPMTASAMGLLTFCCLIWGVGLVMVKISNAEIPPILNAGLRSVVAGVVLFAWAMWRGVPLFARDGTLWAGLGCAVFFALEFMTLYLGLAETPAARATVFLHCAPFVAAAGEHFLVPGHRLTGLRLLGLAAAFAGLLIALSEGLTGVSTIRGDLLCLAGGIFWGLTTIVIKTTALRTAPAEKSLLLQLVFSAPLLIGGSMLLGEGGIGQISPGVAGAFAYTVLAVVVFGYTAWFWLMRTYSAASLHTFTFLTPVFGAMAGAFLLGERLGPATIAGLVLVALGIYLVNRPR